MSLNAILVLAAAMDKLATEHFWQRSRPKVWHLPNWQIQMTQQWHRGSLARAKASLEDGDTPKDLMYSTTTGR